MRDSSAPRGAAVATALVVVGIVAVVVGALGFVLDWGATAGDAAPSPSTTPPTTPAATTTPATTTPTTSTAAAAATTTVAPTTTTAAVRAPGRDDITAFAVALYAAIATGDKAFLVAHLDPVATGVFGADACARKVAAMTDPTSTFTAGAVDGPASFTYATSGVSVVVPGVWTVHGTATAAGTGQPADVHVGVRGATLTWFTACGTPLPVDQQHLPDDARRT